MLVTELGIVTEVRPLQPKKAEPPMLVTELGIVTDVRLPQPEKELAILPSSVKYCSSSKEVMLVLFLNTAPKAVT